MRPKTDVKLKKLIYIGTRKQQFGGVLTGNTNAKDIISFYKEQVNWWTRQAITIFT
jgi:hypothetical protein